MPILATKLYVPQAQPGIVPRPRLLGRLDEGLHRRLTLISAPPALARPRSSANGSPIATRPPPGFRSPKQAVRRGLEAATSERYRSENPEEFERLVAKRLADSPTLASYYGQALAGSRFDDSAEVGRIGAPTLVIHGSEDRYAPPSNARALAEAIPDARLRILEGAGHLVFVERGEEVNRKVLGFLGEGEPRVARDPAG